MRLHHVAIAAAAALVPLFGSAAPAAASAPSPSRWVHEVAADGIHSVSIKELGSELVFRCLGTTMELVLYVDLPRLDPDIRGRASAYMALIIDDQNILSFQGKLIADKDTASIGVGNKTANDFVHYIANATASVSTSLLVQPPGPGSLHYNLTPYPIAGAAAAFRAAYAGCGLAF